MKKAFALAICALLLSVPVKAQDWSSWGGGYMGLETGAVTGRHDYVIYSLTTGGRPGASEYTSLSGGFVAGYLFDAGDLMVGIEAKVGLGGAGRFVTDPATSTAYRLSQGYYAALVGKVGMPAGAFLPYVSVGLGTSDVVSSSTAPGGGEQVLAYGSSMSVVGMIGTEVAITDHLSAKLEFTASAAVHPLYNYLLGETDSFAPHRTLNVGLNWRF